MICSPRELKNGRVFVIQYPYDIHISSIIYFFVLLLLYIKIVFPDNKLRRMFILFSVEKQWKEALEKFNYVKMWHGNKKPFLLEMKSNNFFSDLFMENIIEFVTDSLHWKFNLTFFQGNDIHLSLFVKITFLAFRNHKNFRL